MPLACGRLGYDPSAVADDAAPAIDASTTDHIRLADGWTASVWRDFSEVIDYREQDYFDGDEVYSNAPLVLFQLAPPFVDGVGVMAGRLIVELSADGTTTEHDYRPLMVNTPGQPDHMSDAVQIPSWRARDASILVSSTSDLQGDGVFLLAQDWALSRVGGYNNVRSVAFDGAGNFDAVGAPEIYWGAHFGLWKYAEPMPEKIINGDVVSAAIQPSNTILAVRRVTNEARVELLKVDSGTHNELLIGVYNGSRMPIVRGTVTSQGATFVRTNSELVEIAAASDDIIIASTLDPDWKWMSAIRVSSGPLAFDGFYLLERNPALNVERVLRIHAP